MRPDSGGAMTNSDGLWRGVRVASATTRKAQRRAEPRDGASVPARRATKGALIRDSMQISFVREDFGGTFRDFRCFIISYMRAEF